MMTESNTHRPGLTLNIIELNSPLKKHSLKLDKETRSRLVAVAQACNHSTLGGRGEWITRSTDRDHPGQHGETPTLLKIQKEN